MTSRGFGHGRFLYLENCVPTGDLKNSVTGNRLKFGLEIYGKMRLLQPKDKIKFAKILAKTSVL